MRRLVVILTLVLPLFVAAGGDEPYRSLYHHTPPVMWMNDPNGMFYDAQTQLWHLYYQHYPDDIVWGPMHWGHSTSKDLKTWEHLPIAIYPDSVGMIFSGSCVLDTNNTAGFGRNAIVAIYTSADKAQTQSIAYSLDGGRTFTPYKGNPVLTGDIADFRDPKVFWDKQADCWTMVLACQQEMRFYQSDDLKQWHFVSSFGLGYGCHGGVWECPDLLQMDDNGQTKWVLICNINPGGPFGGSATQYFVGDWNGKEFKCEKGKYENEKMARWLDYGKDHYATVTWHNAPGNRIVAIGWMSNWQYATALPTTHFRSQNTIARDLSLYKDDNGEYRVRVLPSPESKAIRGDRTKQLPAAAVIEIDVCESRKPALITLSNDKGEQVLMTYDFNAQTFTCDRTKSGKTDFSAEFPAVTTAPLFVKHNHHHLTLYIDHCSIEAFDGEGYWAMTNLVFPTQPYNHITVKGGKAKIYNVNL